MIRLPPPLLHAALAALVLAACAPSASPAPSAVQGAPPAWMLGAFEDDYGSRHTISAEGWTQEDYARYHVVRWNAEGEYLVARNDSANPADGGRWTRIDWVPLAGMEPYGWAYCISTWNAATVEEAEAAATADRATPRTGCGGHPFTRMKAPGGTPPRP
jgi:hypothetical protein